MIAYKISWATCDNLTDKMKTAKRQRRKEERWKVNEHRLGTYTDIMFLICSIWCSIYLCTFDFSFCFFPQWICHCYLTSIAYKWFGKSFQSFQLRLWMNGTENFHIFNANESRLKLASIQLHILRIGIVYFWSWRLKCLEWNFHRVDSI
jgi:hypothetical protein